MKAELISAIRMFVPIQAGDSFTVIRHFVLKGVWTQVAAQVRSPKTGTIGIVTHRSSPKDWSPRGEWPKTFMPLQHFDAGGIIMLIYNGTTMEFSEPLGQGSAGVFFEEKAQEEVKEEPGGCYEEIESDE